MSAPDTTSHHAAFSIGRFATRHWTGIFFVVFGLCLAGLYSAFTMPSSVFPQTNFPRVVILVDNGEMPADEMMATITKPVEEAMKDLPGVVNIRSSTSRGSAQVDVYFNWSVNMEQAELQAHGRLQQARGSLPPTVQASAHRLTFSVFPIVGISVTSPTHNTSELWEAANYIIKPKFLRVPDVATVDLIGGRRPEFHVIVDPLRLSASNLSLGQVSEALAKANLVASAGLHEERDTLFLTLVDGRIATLEQLEEIAITSADGRPVRIRDFARVEQAAEPATTVVTADDAEAVLVMIRSQPYGSTLEIVDHLKAEIEGMKKELPKDIRLKFFYDQSILVRDSVDSVWEAIIFGLILSIVILFFFLKDLGSTMVAIVVIPVTVLVTLLAMKLTGMSYNLMTLGGIAAAIGLVIDDAIVVVEAIHTKMAAGLERLDAVHVAIGEIFLPLVGSTLTPVVVFLPLALLDGLPGVFFRALAMTMSVALLTSLVMAITLTPSLAAWIIRVKPQTTTPSKASLVERTIAGIAEQRAAYWIVAAIVVIVLTAMFYKRSSAAVATVVLENARVQTMVEHLAGHFSSLKEVLEKDAPDRAEFLRTLGIVSTIAFALLALLAAWMLRLFLRIDPRREARVPGSPESRVVHESHDMENSGFLLSRVLAVYTAASRLALRHRFLTLQLCALLLLCGIGIYGNLKSDLLPTLDEGGSVIDYVGPPGMSLSEANRALLELEDYLRHNPEVESFSRRTGTALGLELTEPNEGDFLVKFRKNRTHTTEELMFGIHDVWGNVVFKGLEQEFKAREPQFEWDFHTILGDLINDLTWSAKPIEIKLFSEDMEYLRLTAPAVMTAIEDIHGVDEPSALHVAGTSLSFRVRNADAARYGLNTSEIAAAVEAAKLGAVSSSVLQGDRILPIRVLLDPKSVDRITALKNLHLRTTEGQTILLSQVADVTEIPGEVQIDRENLRQYAAVKAEIADRDLGSTMREIREKIGDDPRFPPGVLEFGGLYKEQQEAFKNLLIVMGMAVLLVFTVLLLEFRSFLQPISIVAGALLALLGTIVALWLMGISENIISRLGAIIGVGIVAKNGILMLDFVDKLRTAGLPLEEALIQSGRRRLRPVLMTSLAAALGMLPLAWGVGSGADMLRPLAVAVIGALCVSVLLSLLATPTIYYLLEEGKGLLTRWVGIGAKK